MMILSHNTIPVQNILLPSKRENTNKRYPCTCQRVNDWWGFKVRWLLVSVAWFQCVSCTSSWAVRSFTQPVCFCCLLLTGWAPKPEHFKGGALGHFCILLLRKAYFSSRWLCGLLWIEGNWTITSNFWNDRTSHREEVAQVHRRERKERSSTAAHSLEK